MLFGLVAIGLGLYGIHEMTKTVKYTKKDLQINQGVGTLLEQKSNIDKNFIDILDYSGAKCKIKNKKIINAEPNGYGGMELYLMQKGYSKEAIDYAKKKYDDIANKSVKAKNIKIQSDIDKFEYALHNTQTKELAVSFKINGYSNQHQLNKDNIEVIKYLHTHGNPNARVNVIVGGTTPTYDFNVTWVFFAPIGYDPHDYILNIQKKLGQG